jgi:hypothetical protein
MAPMTTSPPTGPAAEPSAASPSASAAPADAPAVTTAGWPVWQAVALRFALVYALLYASPEPVRLLLRAVDGVFDSLAWRLDLPWLGGAPFAWCGAAATWLGGVEGWWGTAMSWLAERGLTPYPVLVQPTGSGDTGLEIARTLTVALGSTVVALAWSLLVRGPVAYPRAGRWLHLYVRWWLAFALLVYGVAKLYVGQFGELGNRRLLTTIGDASPMDLLWTFMAASRPYEVLTGVLEILPALLLFHRRTALLGAVLAAVVLANVVALNWCYDVPVKLYSTHLLVAALALLLPWRGPLWSLFVANRSCEPPDLAVVRVAWLRATLTVAGALLVAAHLLTLHVEHAAFAAGQATKDGPKPVLHGVWEVESMKVERPSADPAGVPAFGEVPPSDATRWRRLVIGSGRRAYAEDLAGARIEFDYGEDLAAGVVTLQPRTGDGAAKWTVRREVATRQVLHPAPETMADFNRRIDQTRAVLILGGSYAGKRVELQLVERVFDLQRGFHLRQEYPYGR